MVENYDYSLNRLDEWHYGLFERNYTQDMAEEIKDRLRDRFSGTLTMDLIVSHGLFKKIDLEGMLKDSRGFFTKHYYICKEFIIMYENRNDNEDHDEFEELMKKYPKECFDSLYGNTKKFYELLEKIKNWSDENFPDDLEDNKIKSMIFNEFEGIKGYVEFYRNLIMSVIPTIKIACEIGLSPREYLEPNIQIAQAFADEMPRLIETLLKR